MPEPSLNVKLSDLQREVGLFLGYGPAPAAWSDLQRTAVGLAVASGLRQFYYPPECRGVPAGYEWSWRRPEVDLALAAGADACPVPADLGGVEGRVTVVDATMVTCPVAVSNPERLRVAAALNPGRTGRPELCAQRPLLGTEAGRGQRWELAVFPAADRAYTLRAACYLDPDALSADRPYAYGGAAHAETIVAACIAAAANKLDNTRTVERDYFQERLGVSVAMDQPRKGQLLGYNGDRSDGYDRPRRLNRHGWDGITVLVNGGEPE